MPRATMPTAKERSAWCSSRTLMLVKSTKTSPLCPRQAPRLAARRGHHGHELLDALVLLDLARVDVPFGIHHDGVDPVELPGVGAVPAETADRLAAGAIEDPHLVVGPVSHVEILLLRVARDCQLVGRAARREVLAVETAAILRALRGRVRRYVELL